MLNIVLEIKGGVVMSATTDSKMVAEKVTVTIIDYATAELSKLDPLTLDKAAVDEMLREPEDEFEGFSHEFDGFEQD